MHFLNLTSPPKAVTFLLISLSFAFISCSSSEADKATVNKKHEGIWVSWEGWGPEGDKSRNCEARGCIEIGDSSHVYIKPKKDVKVKASYESKGDTLLFRLDESGSKKLSRHDLENVSNKRPIAELHNISKNDSVSYLKWIGFYNIKRGGISVKVNGDIIGKRLEGMYFLSTKREKITNPQKGTLKEKVDAKFISGIFSDVGVKLGDRERKVERVLGKPYTVGTMMDDDAHLYRSVETRGVSSIDISYNRNVVEGISISYRDFRLLEKPSLLISWLGGREVSQKKTPKNVELAYILRNQKTNVITKFLGNTVGIIDIYKSKYDPYK